MKRSLVVAIGVLVAWSAFRIFIPMTSGVEEIIFKPLIYLLPVWWVVFKVEKNNEASLGITSKKPGSAIGWGIVVALGLIAYKLIIDGLAHRQLPSPDFTNQLLLWNLLVSLCTAISEEILFRGFLQTRILSGTNSVMISVALSNFFFVIIHFARAVFVLHYGLPDILQYSLILIFLGTVNSLLFWRTKNILAPITTHTLWNFWQSL